MARDMDFETFVTDARTQGSFRDYPADSYMRRTDGREQCAAYIRIEHFAEDAAPLAAHLGFDLSLPRQNVTVRDRDYRRYYSDASVQAVANSCARDIARFGYEFDAAGGTG